MARDAGGSAGSRDEGFDPVLCPSRTRPKTQREGTEAQRLLGLQPSA
ncbi:hypothetical protein GGQ81_000215 [Sphingomonas desiccabilis]|nr:hypothetical protein [Sphingomonas desiccabilis]